MNSVGSEMATAYTAERAPFLIFSEEKLPAGSLATMDAKKALLLWAAFKTYEAIHGRPVTEDVARRELAIVVAPKGSVELHHPVVSLYHLSCPLVRLYHRAAGYELHVLRADLSSDQLAQVLLFDEVWPNRVAARDRQVGAIF